MCISSFMLWKALFIMISPRSFSPFFSLAENNIKTNIIRLAIKSISPSPKKTELILMQQFVCVWVKKGKRKREIKNLCWTSEPWFKSFYCLFGDNSRLKEVIQSKAILCSEVRVSCRINKDKKKDSFKKHKTSLQITSFQTRAYTFLIFSKELLTVEWIFTLYMFAVCFLINIWWLPILRL